MTSKASAIKILSGKRRADRLSGSFNVGDFHEGRYETHEFVSPFTKSACNFNSELMLIGQDWFPYDKLVEPFNQDLAGRGFVPSIPTNRNLRRLLTDHFNLKFEDTYATNLFVFIKSGGVNNPINDSDLLYSCENYTLPEISIIKPKIVICLGIKVFKIISRAAGSDVVSIENSLDCSLEYEGVRLVGAYHPGGQGTAQAGGTANVNIHWKAIGDLYRTLLSRNSFNSSY